MNGSQFKRLSDFHTYHIWRWLTGCEELRKRYLEICNQKIWDDDRKAALLENFVKTVRDDLMSMIDWRTLVEQGKKKGVTEKEKKSPSDTRS